jgi:hypothetical protein
MAQPPHRPRERTEEPLPDVLARLLHRARDGERSAAGSDRVLAYRLTRALLGGAHVAGYRYGELAACLGVSVSSMRARAYSDDWVSQRVAAELTGLTQATLNRWRRQGRLAPRTSDRHGHMHVLASDLIIALVGVPTSALRPAESVGEVRSLPQGPDSWRCEVVD